VKSNITFLFLQFQLCDIRIVDLTRRRLRLGTTSNPQTPWQGEHVFKITQGMVELELPPEYHPVHGTSRQVEVIPSNSSVFSCL